MIPTVWRERLYIAVSTIGLLALITPISGAGARDNFLTSFDVIDFLRPEEPRLAPLIPTSCGQGFTAKNLGVEESKKKSVCLNKEDLDEHGKDASQLKK